MALIASEDFEGGAPGDQVVLANTSFTTFSGGDSSTLTLDSKLLWSGNSFKLTYVGTFRQARWNITPTGTIKSRFFVNFGVFPSNQAGFASLRGSGSYIAQLQIRNAGTVRIQNGQTAIDASIFDLSLDTTYYLEWEVGAGAQVLRIYSADGATLLDTLSGAAVDAPIDQIGLGAPNAETYTAWMDTPAFDDATQPGYPGVIDPDPGTTDTYIWDGTQLVAADVYVWDGSALVASDANIA